MRAELSIVIPTLDAAEGLGRALPALAEGLQEGLIRELIISDGGSKDATLEIADEAGAVVVTGEASRGGQLGRGAAAAGGSWLLFLHADTVLPSGWATMVRAQMEDGRPAFFGLRYDAAGFAPAWVASWANLRSWVFHLPYGDQGLLISRREYDAVGGYPDIALMEDVAIVRVLGKRMRRLPGKVTTSAARYRQAGWFSRGARNLVLLMRYLMGARPEDLARRY
ncbi:rSAM/selenodomain-associated transferase 2 [Roseovarius halotolerans]|uniref:PGL/p-HBAD biosynthesis glycosyltransferase/MT3031 n=1 Tax=Roseovarius halotolerans TaxID=505353 RepID=A0A1X6Y732_9RHOB|nr:TIGR04283 family arsenosugar biosynthesis glycosyltransferase [Roseovarius halotolerans]RKT35182.1 rSAM/selenodomain-associated transferase 2 [Roseovarius halotolerans]SLN12615.1 PGL/p-HBAD biosynthesis glycosyltransferase/MT3031 [Roseovarius halotolerans]